MKLNPTMKSHFTRDTLNSLLAAMAYFIVIIILYLHLTAPYQLGKSLFFKHASGEASLHVNHSIIALLIILFFIILTLVFYSRPVHSKLNYQRLIIWIFVSVALIIFLSFQKPDLFGHNISGLRSIKGINFIGALILCLPAFILFFFIINIIWKKENKIPSAFIIKIIPVCLFYFCLLKILAGFYLMPYNLFDHIFTELGGRG